MADFLLVHGAWHGGWCWRRLTPLLQAAGHRVHAPTLTGVGERSHLLDADVGLSTHVEDVIAALDAEEMQAPILVGHSYAGMVITGAADRLTARGTTIGRLVYLDAVVPLAGESWSSRHAPDTVAARIAAAAASGGLTLPPPDPSIFGLAGADREWVARRQTPHPFSPYRTPLDFDTARWKALPRTFVDCVEPPLATIDASRVRVREQGDWDIRVLHTGHDPMISDPQGLAEILLSLAR
ncbi:MAG: alpha/beta fold hydrolase [Lautropia sp.]